MLCTCPIPAQRQAVAYLDRLAERVGGGLMVGGHSKGGNLSVYAASQCREETQARIVRVYNHDGPGFVRDSGSLDHFEGTSRVRDDHCDIALLQQRRTILEPRVGHKHLILDIIAPLLLVLLALDLPVL